MELPHLKTSFANYTDDDCKNVIAGKDKTSTIRQKAFELLAREITPPHMLDEAAQPKKAPVLPLAGISQSAARGIVKAVNEGLVRPHALWIALAVDYPAIEAAAEQGTKG